nr:hypothetical protein [Tanacetum cinerariifolium]
RILRGPQPGRAALPGPPALGRCPRHLGRRAFGRHRHRSPHGAPPRPAAPRYLSQWQPARAPSYHYGRLAQVRRRLGYCGKRAAPLAAGGSHPACLRLHHSQRFQPQPGLFFGKAEPIARPA